MGGKSSSSQASSQNSSVDNRSVNDAGGGVAGSGNWWDQSTRDSGNTTWQQWSQATDNRQTTDSGNTTWTQSTADNRSTSNSGNTTWTQSTSNTDNRSTSNSGNTTWNSDSSNRSTTNWDASNRSTNNWDASNRSTNNWDASNRSTNNFTSNVTDGGAFKGMTDIGLAQADVATKVAQIAANNASDATAAATKAQEAAFSSAGDSMRRALDFVSSFGTQVAKSNSEALGMAFNAANGAAAAVQGAYSTAASQSNGNKTLVIASLAAVGLVAALVVFKKG